MASANSTSLASHMNHTPPSLFSSFNPITPLSSDDYSSIVHIYRIISTSCLQTIATATPPDLALSGPSNNTSDVSGENHLTGRPTKATRKSKEANHNFSPFCHPK